MLNLTMIDILLSINEMEIIEDIVLTLLATPQLVIFFEKYPNIKKILLRDLLAWKNFISQMARDLCAHKINRRICTLSAKFGPCYYKKF